MQTINIVLQVLSATSIGLLVGALLTEGGVFVPHWQSLPADEFHTLYKQLHPHLYRYFTPITVAPLLLSLASAVTSVVVSANAKLLIITAFVLCLSLTLTHELYFKRANTQFANASLGPAELAAELKRWAAWHWARTVMGLIALVLSIVVLAF